MYIGNDLQVAESGNKIIDDISSSFNGSTTSFALLVGGAAPVPFPINTQQIYISVNGVLQEPDPTGSAGFKLLGNNIVFSSAPANGHAFFGVILSGADYVTVGTEFPAGSATAPSITFGNDDNTGLYSVTGGTVGFTSDGVQTFTMDSNGFNFPDSKKVNLGSSSDLQLYHDGSNSYIEEAGTGSLFLRATPSIEFRKAGGTEKMLYAEPDAQVELYYDNTKRFETTNTGTNVIGIHVDDGATHDGDVTFTGAAASVTWDKSADDLIFNDNAKAAFGTSSDLNIYHDGSHSYIDSTGTGYLLIQDSGNIYIRTNDFRVQTSGGSETCITCSANGAVSLNFDNSTKFATTSSGATITGDLIVGQITSSGNITSNGTYLTLTGNSYNAWWDKAASALEFQDNAKATFGTANDLQIYHDGSNSYIKDAGTGNLYIFSENLRIENADGSESYIEANVNGSVELYYDNSKKFETTSTGAKVSNVLEINSNGTSIAENNLNFEPSGNVYIDHRTTSQDIIFRMSNSSALDTTALTIKADGSTTHPDAIKSKWGAGDDLQIYHDGSNSYVHNDNGSGNFYIQGDAIRLRSKTGTEDYIVANHNGSVELYYDNAKTFETGTTGAILKGGNTGAATELQIFGNEGQRGILLLAADDGDDNADYWHFEAGTDGNLNIQNYSGGSWENSLLLKSGAAVELYYDDAKKLETTSAGATVTGSQNSAVELRIENTNNSQNAAIAKLSLHGGDAANQGPIIELDRNGAYHQIEEDASGNLDFSDNGTVKYIMESDGDFQICDGDLIIGTSGHGIDFSATGGPTGTGASSDSEVLSDYEHGTWVPLLRNGTNEITYTTGNASTKFTYVKIGRLVHLTFCLNNETTAGTTGGSSSFQILNAPFAPAAERIISTQVLWYATGLRINQTPIFMHLHTAGNFEAYRMVSATGGYTSNNCEVEQVGASSYMFWRMSYETSS